MKKSIILVVAAQLAGCSPAPVEAPTVQARDEAVPAEELKAIRAKLAAAEAKIAKAEAKERARIEALSEPDPEVSLVDADSSTCWADYCPCNTSDPDYGDSDITICRNLKMGVPVDDGLFAGAAALREARRINREYEERIKDF